MHTMSRAVAGGKCLMAQADKMNGSGNGGNVLRGSEPSLADGTGEGNAPIEGTSASSDPNVLAGTTENATAAPLNDDDYPDNIAEAAGSVDDGNDSASQPDDAAAGLATQAAPDEGNTSGQHTLPDEAAGIDLKDGVALPDGTGKK
jgi:hypothetical protein